MNHSEYFNNYGLVLYLTLTVIRQGTHLLHLRYRASSQVTHRYAGNMISTIAMYFLYLVIWFGSVFSYVRSGTNASYYLAGMVLLLVGICIRYLGVKALGRNFASSIVIRDEHRLITSGIYSMFRHPIHLALLIELGGMAVIAPSLVTFVAFTAVASIVIWRNKHEDKVLITCFGKQAERYCRSVPAMNPLPLFLAGIKELAYRSTGELRNRG